LVNGTRGVVVDFDYASDDKGRKMIHGRKVCFSRNARILILTEPMFIQYPVCVFETGNGPPICKTVAEFIFEVELAPTKSICRRMIPLIFGWAITIHKVIYANISLFVTTHAFLESRYDIEQG
jgi:hypothetical protein